MIGPWVGGGLSSVGAGLLAGIDGHQYSGIPNGTVAQEILANKGTLYVLTGEGSNGQGIFAPMTANTPKGTELYQRAA